MTDQVSVSQSTVAMWESNKRKVNTENLLKTSQLFIVSTDYLLGNNSKPNSANKNTNDLYKFLKTNFSSITCQGEIITQEEKIKTCYNIDFLRTT